MNSIVRLLCCFATLVCVSPAAVAEKVDKATPIGHGASRGRANYDAFYHQAMKHYFAGRYDKAIEQLELIVAAPIHHPDLFYNLGCAYFRRGEPGRAIYNFERAIRLDPEAEDARFNLETVRAIVAGSVQDVLKGVGKQPWWRTVIGLLSPTTWAALFLFVWWLLFSALLLLRRTAPGPLRAGLIAGCVLLGTLSATGGAIVVGQWVIDRRVTEAIVLPDKVDVREGSSPHTRKLFSLHAGLRLTLLADAGGWVRVRLPNGLEGWLPRDQVGIL